MREESVGSMDWGTFLLSKIGAAKANDDVILPRYPSLPRFRNPGVTTIRGA